MALVPSPGELHSVNEPHLLDTLPHAGDSEMIGSREPERIGGKTAAIVANFKLQPLGVERQIHVDARRIDVRHGVSNGLPRHQQQIAADPLGKR
jgi:hypothetical protein